MTKAEKEKAMANVHVIQNACMNLLSLLPPDLPEDAPALPKVHAVLREASVLEFRIVALSTEETDS